MRRHEVRQRLALGIVGGGLVAALGLAGCSGLFAPRVDLPTLYVGDIERRGDEGSALVSVSSVPGGGLAAIQFGEAGHGAIALAGIDPTSVHVEGEGGFIVLAETWDETGGSLVAANPAGGTTSGAILRLRFACTDERPTLTVSQSHVVLASDAGWLVTSWTLKTGADYAYYSR